MWYRVFGMNEAQPEPEAFLAHLQSQGFAVRGHFRGDDQGWFEAKFDLSDGLPSFDVERYLASEEGIRADLNTWAAWLEISDSPHSERLMQDVIGATQLFTLQDSLDDDDENQKELMLAICRFLAQETGGFYQVDGQGFFSAEGTLLVKE